MQYDPYATWIPVTARSRPLPDTTGRHRFRLCRFCPPLLCWWGDKCTFAHSNEELFEWNQLTECYRAEPRGRHERRQNDWPQPHAYTRPNYKQKRSTFLERVKEELDVENIKPHLTASNYKGKFHQLLCWEEKEHITTLYERCDGIYTLNVAESLPLGIRRHHADPKKIYGYLEVTNEDIIAYATQASEAVYLIDEKFEIKAEVMRYNYSHIGNRMYISMDETSKIPKPRMEIEAQFEVKHFYFNSLHDVLNNIPDEVVRKLFPQEEDFDGEVRAEGIVALNNIPMEYREILHLDKMNAENLLPYQVALTCKSGAPPVLISGAFGTGKTCFISSVAYCFITETERTHVPAHVLICAHHQATADTIMDTYFGPMLMHKTCPFRVKVVRITSNNVKNVHNHDFYITIQQLKEMFADQFLRKIYTDAQRLVIITTFLTSLHLKELLPRGFITHILIDEGAQAREPEAIAPLCLADRKTKIIIAGDPRQVGPGLLVLGEEARKYGLKVSLLERLHTHYKAIGEMSKYLQADLTENYRCHPLILKFASEMFYKSTIKPSIITSRIPNFHGFKYPLVFVCTDIEEIESYEKSVNEKEANILMDMLDHHHREEMYMCKVCIMSSSRNQVTVLRKKNCLPHSVHVLPTFDIQGQEYDALYISTCECTYPNGETCNPTKSVCDPYVFNTAITRARSLIIGFGNPYLLLSIEKHMNIKYNRSGHCWSQYIKMCILNNTLIIPSSITRNQQHIDVLTGQLLTQINSVLSARPSTQTGHFDSRPRRVMNTQLPATKKTFSATGGSFSYEKIPTLKMSVHPITESVQLGKVPSKLRVYEPLIQPSKLIKEKRHSQANYLAPSKPSVSASRLLTPQKHNEDTAFATPKGLKPSGSDWHNEMCRDSSLYSDDFPTLKEANKKRPSKRQRQRESASTQCTTPEHTQYYQYFEKRLDLDIFKGPLTINNYKERFHHLLCWEEKEHMRILKERCNGTYNIKVLPPSEAKKQWSGKLWHATEESYYGTISSVDKNDDTLSYAKQASEAAHILFNQRRMHVSIRQSPRSQGITVSFSSKADYSDIERRVSHSGIDCHVIFELKHSYFNRQHQALNALELNVIKKLIPSEKSRNKMRHLNINNSSLYLDDSGQMQALVGILNQHEDSSPVIIAGPFGTGKTRVLARAAYELAKKDQSHKILICTHHQISADTFIDYFGSLKDKNIKFVRIATFNYKSRMKEKYPTHYIGVRHYIGVSKATFGNPQVIVTTLGLAHHINIKTFTHIIIDEAAQTRETEAIIPLQHASSRTKIVLAGDHCQVGPNVLVLGEEARRYGLSTSLLERLHKQYSDKGEKSLSFSLLQNYRSHSGLLMLPSSLFYRSTLQCNVPDNLAHPYSPFPLVFVCSNIENIPPINLIGTDEEEAKILVKEVKRYIFNSWPESWGKKCDPPGQVCIMTPSATQKSIIINKLKPRENEVDVLKAYDIQGCEFTAIFIGTCENTDENGTPKNTTKTIMNRYVFNTALTRARYLVVAVGNPLQLLDKEENIAKLDPENHCFPCWREYIRRCIECKSFHLPEGLSTEKLKEFTAVLYKRIFSQDDQVHASDNNFNMMSYDSILSAYKEKFEKIPECKSSKLRLSRVNNRLTWNMKESPSEHQIVSNTDNDYEDQTEVYDCKLNMIFFSYAEGVPLDPTKRVVQLRGMGNIKGAFHEDIVKVLVFNDLSQSQCKGRVVSVIKKCHKQTIVCKAHRYNSILFCPLDKRYPLITNLPKLSRDLLEKRDKRCIMTELESKDVVVFKPSSVFEGNIPEIKNVIPHTVAQDMLFVVKILVWNPKYRLPLGVVVHALPKGCSEFHAERILMIEHNVNYGTETEDFKTQSVQCTASNMEVDTRAFTIDPDDAINLDDALSLSREGDAYQLAVHIVDTTNEITSDSELDRKAKMKGTSVYGGRQVMHMLPSRIRSKLSLNPHQLCDAITIRADILIDDEGLISIGNIILKESKIRSCAKLSYRSAQKIMEGVTISSQEILKYIADYDNSNEQPHLRDTLIVLFKIAMKLRTDRLGEVAAHSYEMDDPNEQVCWQMHLMVEEMMIWANNVVAKNILSALPESALLRKQNATNEDEFSAASNAHSHVLVYSNFSPFAKPPSIPAPLVIPLSTMRIIMLAINAKNTTLLRNLFTDFYLFPQLTALSAHFRKVHQKAEYVSATADRDLAAYRHYHLNLPEYTHFTSPLRRYSDIVVQRMIKSVMRNERCNYNHEEIVDLCHNLNGTFRNAKSFERKMKVLRLAIEYSQSSVLYEAVVTENTRMEIEVSFLNRKLNVIPKKHKRFKISHLRCDKMPAGVMNNSDSAVYKWKVKMLKDDSSFPYDYKGLTFHSSERFITSDFKAAQTAPYITMTLLKELESNMLKPVLHYVDIYPIATTISHSDWRHIEKFVYHPSEDTLTQVQKLLSCSEPVISKSTIYDKEMIIKSPIVNSDIHRRLDLYDMVKVWMTWSTRESILSPQLQLLEITPFFHICLQHNAHPAECFSDSCLTNASKECYTDLKEYVNLWEKVLLSEAAERSVIDNRSGILCNIKLEWGELITSNDPDITHYKPKDGIIHCNLPTNIMKNAMPFLKVHEGDLMCVRYGTGKDSITRAVFHLVVTGHEGETLKLKSVCRDNLKISEKMKAMIEKETCEVQVISMSPSYQRVYKVLLGLLYSNRQVSELLKVVARGRDDRRLQKLPKSQVVSLEPLQKDFKTTTLWSTKDRLNSSQKEAMKLALTKRFQLIQGPPGTGKSETGAHIAYALAMSNRIMAIGHRKCVLYCGPTNKAVDVVLRNLDKVSDELKVLRVYGQSVESRDHPGPHYEKDTFQVSDSSYRCPEWARKYALHWKIRSTPNATDLIDLEKVLSDGHKQGNIPSAAKFLEWKSLIDEVEVTVMNESFDIVMCTCNEAASKRITKNLFDAVMRQTRVSQCIIDESGMAYEPETIVPMSLCEHVILLGDHKQLQPVIQYKPARENGLTTSLFERYAKTRKSAYMLNIQYRMHEAICQFPSDHFYDGKLNTDISVKQRKNYESKLKFWPNGPNLPILFCDFVGKEPEHGMSKLNPQEAEKVVEIVKVIHEAHKVKLTEIAVLTPYKAQKSCLKELADKAGLLGPEGLVVATITESQGDEYGIVILSTVRSQPLAEIDNEDHIQPDRSWLLENLGFLTDEHEINVGITRSKHGLIIVGNMTLLKYDKTWKALITHYEDRKCIVHSSEFPSEEDLKK